MVYRTHTAAGGQVPVQVQVKPSGRTTSNGCEGNDVPVVGVAVEVERSGGEQSGPGPGVV